MALGTDHDPMDANARKRIITADKIKQKLRPTSVVDTRLRDSST